MPPKTHLSLATAIKDVRPRALEKLAGLLGLDYGRIKQQMELEEELRELRQQQKLPANSDTTAERNTQTRPVSKPLGKADAPAALVARPMASQPSDDRHVTLAPLKEARASPHSYLSWDPDEKRRGTSFQIRFRDAGATTQRPQTPGNCRSGTAIAKILSIVEVEVQTSIVATMPRYGWKPLKSLSQRRARRRISRVRP